jgi:hypothetical protein
MTEHVTQDGRLWGIRPCPLLQIFVRNGMLYIKRQPVSPQHANFANGSPFCEMKAMSAQNIVTENKNRPLDMAN